ncbi:MAG: YeeE/YedE thiosulfate transporter family protein [Gemmatimonadales bacterium]
MAGVGLGLVLLSTYAVMGHGIGASGAFAATASAAVAEVAPSHAAANSYYRSYNDAGGPFTSWIVIEVLGIVAGAFVSALLAGRLRRGIERGPRVAAGTRLAWAFAGGSLMGFASRLARGCTSGLALTGGAALSVGSWVFMLALFGAAYALAPALRRQWR